MNNFSMEKEYKTKFPERFRELKKNSGLSDFSLGKLLGVAPATICRWENGVNDIKSNELIKVALFFQVELDYLVGMDDIKDNI